MKESKTKSNVKNTDGKKRQALPPPPIKKQSLEEQINSKELLDSFYEKHGVEMPFFIEFDEPKEVEKITKGVIYSIVNENGETEIGECVDYNRVTGRVTLKKKT